MFSFISGNGNIYILQKKDTSQEKRRGESPLRLDASNHSCDVDDRGYAYVGWASIWTVMCISWEQSLCGVKGDQRYISGWQRDWGGSFPRSHTPCSALPENRARSQATGVHWYLGRAMLRKNIVHGGIEAMWG